MAQPQVLVVEDDAELRSLLTRTLTEQGFAVTAARDGTSALDVDSDAVDVIVLDIGLPDADGRDVCQALRARGTEAPVLFLTARDAVTDRVSGFAIGGDDYVVKPFHLEELVARLRALLRRSGAHGADRVGDLVLDPVAHAISGGLATASVTPTEFRLLASLAARPGEVVRRRELVAAGWPEGAIVHDNTLDQYIARLRRKVAAVSADAGIVTVHGVGYQLS
jgi:two-component system response regulator MprA